MIFRYFATDNSELDSVLNRTVSHLWGYLLMCCPHGHEWVVTGRKLTLHVGRNCHWLISRDAMLIQRPPNVLAYQR